MKSSLFGGGGVHCVDRDQENQIVWHRLNSSVCQCRVEPNTNPVAADLKCFHRKALLSLAAARQQNAWHITAWVQLRQHISYKVKWFLHLLLRPEHDDLWGEKIQSPKFCTFKNAIQKVKTTARKTFSKPPACHNCFGNSYVPFKSWSKYYLAY